MRKKTNSTLSVQEQLTQKIVRRTTVKGTVLVALGAILWAFSSGCGQYLMGTKGMDSGWLASTRILIAGVLLTVIGIIQNGKALKTLIKNKKDLLSLLLFGVFGLMLAQYSFIKTIAVSNSAATATVLQYTGPILIVIFVCIKNLRLPHITEAISIVLAVAGVFLLATKGDFSTLAISKLTLFWGLLSALGLVFYSLLPQKIIPKYGSILITGLGMVCGGIVMLFIVRPWNIPVRFDLMTVLAYIGVAIVGTTIGYTLYMQGVADIGPVKSSMIASIEPVASAVFSALLGTKFVWWQDYAGMACIISTVFILSIPPKNQKVSFKPENKKLETENSEVTK